MNDAAAIRVFLLDDHEVVRQGLRALLESAGDIEVVGESGLGQSRRPPGSRRCGPTSRCSTPGCPTGRASRSAAPSARVDPTISALILTSYDDDEALFAAIMAGAAGYVLKEITGQDLVGAVRQVAAGQLADRPGPDRAGARAGAQRPGTAPSWPS